MKSVRTLRYERCNAHRAAILDELADDYDPDSPCYGGGGRRDAVARRLLEGVFQSPPPCLHEG